MSRIIKNSEVLSNPRIIEIRELARLETKVDSKELTDIDNIAQEREEIEQLKTESENILKETEQMVLELLQKARDEAKTIIADAQEDADLIRAQVYEEAQNIRQKAEQEGYEEGLKRAQEEIEADRQMSLEQSRQIIEDARNKKLAIIKSTEADIVRLALAVARKVIAYELQANPDSVLSVVREAISFLDQPENVTIYVNPQDMDRLSELMETESLNDIGNSEVNVQLRADSRITTGGCIVESDGGSVDAQIETRISNVEDAVQEVAGDE